MRALKRGLAYLLLVGACAQQGAPPGGPPDRNPPQLLQTSPESLAIMPGFDGSVEFLFDEAIAEGAPNFGRGDGALERLILISPDTQVPHVSWKGRRVLVRPRNGWKENTLYRIELAPGVADYSGNTMKQSHVISFTTATSLASRYVQGQVVDWASRQFLAGALVEAITRDGKVYRTRTDSAGGLGLTGFGPLPASELLIRAVSDRSANNRLDYGESWDTLRLATDQESLGELWIYNRDTVAARHVSASKRDSVTIAIEVDHPLDPNWQVPGDSVEIIVLPDSARSLGMFAVPRAFFDSMMKSREAPTPIAAPPVLPPPGDTSPPAKLPSAKKPTIGTTIIVQVRGLVADNQRYRIILHGVRTINGITGDVTSDFTTPKAPAKAADSTAAGRGGSGG